MHFLAQLAGMLASIQVVPGPIVESLLSPLEFLISTTLIFSLVCQTYRYVRVSTTAERLQTRWFVVGFAAFLAISSLSAWVPANAAELDLLSTITLPLSIAISILRYRLWDIDVIIRRTLVYGALTALLAVVYIGSVVSLQTLLRPLVGTDTALATVASTLAIAALFQPLRHRMQALIDRHFYRRKYDAQQTVEAFSARLRAETDLETLVHDLTTVVQETMQPTHNSLWLRDESRHAVKQRSEAR
jgi:hypothetical protein